jgi:hypothetical protein
MTLIFMLVRGADGSHAASSLRQVLGTPMPETSVYIAFARRSCASGSVILR